jgi:hypothetical protein
MTILWIHVKARGSPAMSPSVGSSRATSLLLPPRVHNIDRDLHMQGMHRSQEGIHRVIRIFPVTLIMLSQILLFDQSRSAAHLLRRLLGPQTKLSYLDHPFSASRGKQVEWLIGHSHENGMPDSLQGPFDAAVQEGKEKWEQALGDAKQQVSRSQGRKSSKP